MRDLRTKYQQTRNGWFSELEYDEWGQPNFADDYIPQGAFQKMTFLSYVVWPEHLVGIGGAAFAGCNLRGSLIFPEGVKHIGGDAFEAYGHQMSALSGEVYIPSSVEYIGYNAFGGNDGRRNNLTGELILPTKMKFLASGVFSSLYLTGKIIIPEGLTEVCAAFPPNMTGDVRIPQGVKRISGIGGKPTSIYIPEGVEVIGNRSLTYPTIKGDIHLPSSVQKIEEGAFHTCGMSHINIPEGIELRANAPEISTSIPFFIVMKSDNYPHANLANLAEGVSLRPRLSALPSVCSRTAHTSDSVCDLRDSRDSREIRSFVREDSGASALQVKCFTYLLPSYLRT